MSKQNVIRSLVVDGYSENDAKSIYAISKKIDRIVARDNRAINWETEEEIDTLDAAKRVFKKFGWTFATTKNIRKIIG